MKHIVLYTKWKMIFLKMWKEPDTEVLENAGSWEAQVDSERSTFWKMMGDAGDIDQNAGRLPACFIVKSQYTQTGCGSVTLRCKWVHTQPGKVRHAPSWIMGLWFCLWHAHTGAWDTVLIKCHWVREQYRAHKPMITDISKPVIPDMWWSLSIHPTGNPFQQGKLGRKGNNFQY